MTTRITLYFVFAIFTIANDLGDSPQEQIKKIEGVLNRLKDVETHENDKFNYPKEIEKFSAIYRLELRGGQDQIFQYKITHENNECEIDLANFISETNAQQGAQFQISITLFSPTRQIMKNYLINNDNNNPQTEFFQLNQIGNYSFAIKNNSSYAVVLDMMFQMKNCHKIKHKLHKDDLIVFKNKFEDTFQDHVKTINSNLLTKYKTKLFVEKSFEDSHQKLYYSALLESLLIFVASIAQILYMRKILEYKEIIQLIMRKF